MGFLDMVLDHARSRLASVRSDATLVRVFAIGDAALSKAAWPADHVTTTIAATHV